MLEWDLDGPFYSGVETNWFGEAAKELTFSSLLVIF